MSALFDKANEFNIDRYPNVFSSVSVGGHARVERAGLSFYYVSVLLPSMTESEYRSIEAELLVNQDGASLFTTTIPNGHTNFNGSWTGTPVIQSSSGRNVTVSGFTPSVSDVIKAGDWLQFTGTNGGTKVYQSTSTVSSDAFGLATINVSTDFVTQPTSATTITRGASVNFRLLMTAKPSVFSIPGFRGQPLYTFSGPFTFREVL